MTTLKLAFATLLVLAVPAFAQHHEAAPAPHPAIPKSGPKPTLIPPKDGTIHELYGPSQLAVVRLRWNAKGNAWMSPNGQGHRIGFTPEYLAHHGWSYKGPAPVAVAA